MSLTSMAGSCRLLCYRIRKKSSDYLSLVRDRKNIIIYYLLKYIWMIIGDQAELYFGSGFG